MNKEQAKERLCAIETEVEKLRRIIDEPEQRKPEAGDVWLEDEGTHHFVNGLNKQLTSSMLNEDGDSYTRHFESDPFGGDIDDFTYLGKFDEVFVKISDVRDALSIVDKEGDDTIGLLRSFDCNQWGAYSTLEALRELNILD